jgi:hypothetical protein
LGAWQGQVDGVTSRGYTGRARATAAISIAAGEHPAPAPNSSAIFLELGFGLMEGRRADEGGGRRARRRADESREDAGREEGGGRRTRSPLGFCLVPVSLGSRKRILRTGSGSQFQADTEGQTSEFGTEGKGSSGRGLEFA